MTDREQAAGQAHGQDGTGESLSGRPQSGPSESSGTIPHNCSFTVFSHTSIHRGAADRVMRCWEPLCPRWEYSSEANPDFVETPLFDVARRLLADGNASVPLAPPAPPTSVPVCARCVSLQEALQRIANQATDLPHARRIDRDEMRAIAREALAASEKEIPGGDPRLSVAEVGD